MSINLIDYRESAITIAAMVTIAIAPVTSLMMQTTQLVNVYCHRQLSWGGHTLLNFKTLCRNSVLQLKITSHITSAAPVYC